VTLLGWSYGGMIITGVAERVPERLAQLVYLDANMPADGENSYDAELFLKRPAPPTATQRRRRHARLPCQRSIRGVDPVTPSGPFFAGQVAGRQAASLATATALR
jgi:pimeloyl-ACP methyl ester carboxylesterase